ncbi:MAG: diacylglycerol kinase family lipid kinase [Acidimicrobiia bacterium]|nr:diacylglycerol kinase family lipid kinase [Acidimicrobiia bacterium]
MDRAIPWTAVVNPAAGRGRTRRLLPRLVDALAASGLDVDVHVTSSGADGLALAEEAHRAGRGVVACGGDGTVSQLAGLAAETGGLLGIVPSGSGNDFARHVGLDHRRPLDAVRVLREGRVGLADLGRANGTWFASVAGTGFDAEANRWANGVDRVSGTTLYVLAVLRTLATYRPQQFHITVDGAAPREVEGWLVNVANGSSYGGGMRIAPGARVDDGLLDVVVVGPVSRLDFLRTFPKVFRGRHVEHPLVEVHRGRHVSVAALDPSSPLELYASGERIGPLPAELEAVPSAVRVVVPPEAPVRWPEGG